MRDERVKEIKSGLRGLGIAALIILAAIGLLILVNWLGDMPRGR